MMTSHDTLRRLGALDSEKMWLFNKKRGAGDNQFGLKIGDVRAMANSIKSRKIIQSMIRCPLCRAGKTRLLQITDKPQGRHLGSA